MFFAHVSRRTHIVSGMTDDEAIGFLTALCATPTAPFYESRVIERVLQFAAQHYLIQVQHDSFGNTLLLRPGEGGNGAPRLIFVAHLDHPGFIAQEMIDKHTLRADFRGGVLATLMAGARARFFTPEREVKAKVIETTQDEAGRCTSATLRVSHPVPPDAIGMFDLTPARVRHKRLHARACDDLAGAAAILVMLGEIAVKPAATDIGVLLTRGEEEGFIGAIAAAQDGSLLQKDDRIISVECSAEQPVAQQGNGVVLRVGDRTSVFNSAFSRFIFDRAQDLAVRDGTFRYQRALMPGGTCEGTVFDAWGYTAAAICVPLGNYHNMDRDRERIAAETVHLDDWRNMVRLFVEIARNVHSFDGTQIELQARLMARFETHRDQLVPLASASVPADEAEAQAGS